MLLPGKVCLGFVLSGFLAPGRLRLESQTRVCTTTTSIFGGGETPEMVKFLTVLFRLPCSLHEGQVLGKSLARHGPRELLIVRIHSQLGAQNPG